MSQNEFDRLEQFVSKLLGKYDQLREENTRLEDLICKKDEEIHDLRAEISSADTERGDITLRVKGLIEQIEEWETAIEEPEKGEEAKVVEDVEDDATDDDTDDVAEGAEVSADADTSGDEEKKGEDKDSSLQQNLFNVQPRTHNMSS